VKRNLSERLRKASLYSSDQAAGYCEYARKKISLLKSLNFNLTDNQLIELVIGDITDAHVKTAAFNSNVDSIVTLLHLLSNYQINKQNGRSQEGVLKRPRPDLFENNHEEFTVCYNCKKPGHIRRNCWKLRKLSSHNDTTTACGSNQTEIKEPCDICKKFGHPSEKCFIKNKGNGNSSKISEIN
jgi:Zinc knuckle